MSSGNVAVPTQFLQTGEQTYAYRRFGAGSAPPLLLLQHFMGTRDNWDPAVTDPLALGREVILFENAGIGRSTGTVAESIAGMAQHVLKFLNGLDLSTCDCPRILPGWDDRPTDRTGSPLRTRVFVPISRVLHTAGDGIPCVPTLNVRRTD